MALTDLLSRPLSASLSPGLAAGGGAAETQPLSGEYNGTWGWTDFSEYDDTAASTATLPDMTEVAELATMKHAIVDPATYGDPFGKTYQMTTTSNFSSRATPIMVSLDFFPTDAEDGECLILVAHNKAGDEFPGPCMAMANPADVRNGVYYAPREGAGNNTYGLAWEGGVLETWASASVAPASNTDQWTWIRLQRIGTAVKGKWWEYLSAEPGSWRDEVTMTSAPDPGKVGLCLPSIRIGTGVHYICSYFAFTSDPSGTPLVVPVA